ncbi:hypothetical protein N7454_007359 [Penicillium verhagenii]|nr:hypothetical protein N7454_007359 [Penicillium verhagenii]
MEHITDAQLQKDEIAQISDLPRLDYDYDNLSVHSIATSVPERERDEAMALARWTQFRLDQQIAKQEAMEQETFEKVRKYHVECLNPWVESVTAALHKLGCMHEETPASATDGEFDINIPIQP